MITVNSGTGSDSGHITLKGLVETLLGGPAKIVRNRCDTLGGYHGDSTGGLFRWSGFARTPRGLRPWSLILKILRTRPQLEGFEAGSVRYWKREALAYGTRFPDSLPPDTFRGPRCFGIEDRGPEVWIWLEDLGERASRTWKLPQFGEAARRAGRLNGAYLAGEAMPDHPWLVKFWHPEWLTLQRPRVSRIVRREIWTVAHGQAWWRPRAAKILGLWARRADLVKILEEMPPTLCHRDLHPANLFLTGDGMIAIDWHTAGRGVVGEDLAALVAGSIQAVEWPWRRLTELEAAVFPAYSTGLAQAGVAIDPATLRRAYAATFALRWGFMPVGTIGDEIRILIEARQGKGHRTAIEVRRSLSKLTALHQHAIALGYEALGLPLEAYPRVK